MEKENSKEVKKRIVALSIIIVVLILAVVGGVFLVNKYNKNKAEEEKVGNIKNVINEYFDAHNNYNVDKYLNVLDLRGGVAFEKCSEDLSKFKETYDAVSEDEIEVYKNAKSNEMDMFKVLRTQTLDYCTTELNNVKDYEEVNGIEGMIKADIETTEKFAYQGNETVKQKEATCYIYNNKIVSMQTVEETETKTDNNSEENNQE